jgi:hypothetical protein
VVTDFGADVSFVDAAKKMQEHYGIDLPASTIRLITEKHAQNMCLSQEKIYIRSNPSKKSQNIIAELDGSMIPIVKINQESIGDKRKTRKTGWREARLSLARAQGTLTPFYKATLGTMDDAGNQLATVAILAGQGENSHVHCVSDGAPWIAEQAERVFGDKHSYLIDFYHLCLYLNVASKCCAPNDANSWEIKQRELMKKNQLKDVMKEIRNHIENNSSDHECGAVKCYQYMEKRTHQFDYRWALENDLPIGSGEIESGHRSVVQKRLKIPGAWWREENAEDMLALRTTRANGCWNTYWKPGFETGVS